MKSIRHCGYRASSLRARGFTLLEVLVALLVLSFGLLGMAGLQATGLRNNNNALQRTHASVLALDVIERMRVNRADAAAGAYNLTMAADPPADTSTVPAADLALWMATLQDRLINGGDGSVTCQTVPPANRAVQCTVVVQWAEVQDAVPGADANTRFVMSTQL